MRNHIPDIRQEKRVGYKSQMQANIILTRSTQEMMKKSMEAVATGDSSPGPTRAAWRYAYC